MDEAIIIQALEQACQGLDLCFQVISQQETLYVCIDRQPEQVLDYDALTVTMRETITPLLPSETKWLGLLSRVAGQAEPDWQATVELTVENDSQTDDSTVASDLSQYCFIRNKALVTTEVLPPGPTVTELVQSFHDLNDTDKQILLPRLEQIFKTQKLGDTTQDSEVIASFCTELTSLNDSEARKSAIWLSRYCYNPELTLAQLKIGVNADSAETQAVEIVVEDPLQGYASSVPIRREPSTTPYKSYDVPYKNHELTPKPTLQLLLIPLLWTMVTLGIVWFNVQANNGPEAIAQLCKNVKDQPEYCKLAVQVVGPQIFETYSKQTKPSNENVAGMATEDCKLQAAFNAGGTIIELMKDENRRKAEPTSVVNQEILPGLFVVDVTQTSLKDKVSTVRTACVYGTLQSRATEKQRAASLGNYVIPNQWPQEALKAKPYNLKVADAQSVHGILSLMGMNTLFSAIGLFLVVCLGLGIRLESLNALYTAAFIFGAVDAMMSLIPMIGQFGIIRFSAVPVVGLMITSLFVKGMELDFSVGYKVLAMGGGILIAVRFMLNWLLLVTIMSMV